MALNSLIARSHSSPFHLCDQNSENERDFQLRERAFLAHIKLLCYRLVPGVTNGHQEHCVGMMHMNVCYVYVAGRQ